MVFHIFFIELDLTSGIHINPLTKAAFNTAKLQLSRSKVFNFLLFFKVSDFQAQQLPASRHVSRLPPAYSSQHIYLLNLHIKVLLYIAQISFVLHTLPSPTFI